jgi:hypothetical protein
MARRLVKRREYALGGVLVLALAAVVVAATLSTRERSSTGSSELHTRPLAATAILTPQSISFGQPVHMRIEAILDRRRLDPERVRLDVNWRPYEPIGKLERTRTDVGSLTRLRWSAELHCIVIECLPTAGSVHRKAFEPSVIRYAGRAKDGKAVEPIRISWPHVNALSWLDPIDLQRGAIIPRVRERLQITAIRPPWRVNLAAAPMSYRISPSTVFWLALVFALALVGAAAVLVRPWLPSLRFGGAPPRSRLERALDAVECARGGEPTDERKALELLAAELRRSGRRGLAWTASELAWSSSAPEAERTEALTTDVRRELAERTNGHRA